MRVQHRREPAGFFRRQVGDQNAVDFRMFRFTDKLLQTKLQEWIEIAEENDRNTRLLSHVTNEIEDFRQTKSMLQRAFGGTLNHGTISHRVGEWNAKLD